MRIQCGCRRNFPNSLSSKARLSDITSSTRKLFLLSNSRVKAASWSWTTTQTRENFVFSEVKCKQQTGEILVKSCQGAGGTEHFVNRCNRNCQQFQLFVEVLYTYSDSSQLKISSPFPSNDHTDIDLQRFWVIVTPFKEVILWSLRLFPRNRFVEISAPHKFF